MDKRKALNTISLVFIVCTMSFITYDWAIARGFILIPDTPVEADYTGNFTHGTKINQTDLDALNISALNLYPNIISISQPSVGDWALKINWKHYYLEPAGRTAKGEAVWHIYWHTGKQFSFKGRTDGVEYIDMLDTCLNDSKLSTSTCISNLKMRDHPNGKILNQEWDDFIENEMEKAVRNMQRMQTPPTLNITADDFAISNELSLGVGG